MPSKADLGLEGDVALPGSGSILLGQKGSLIIPHVAMPQLVGEAFKDYKITVVPARNHYTSWAHACLGEDHATSNFDYSGPLTETVLLGSIACRLPETDLAWDAANMKLTGHAKAQDLLKKPYRSGWEPTWI
jgi:hypothetical protein